jgi:hypothetical protein
VVTSYFEWLGAGVYRVDARSGAMHGKRFLIQELCYGSDGQNLYVRVDFEPGAVSGLSGMDAHLTVQPCADPSLNSFVVLGFRNGLVSAGEVRLARPEATGAVEFAFHKVLEARLSLAALGVGSGQSLRLQLSLWKQGLPVDAIPQEGWLEISTAEPTDWPL